MKSRMPERARTDPWEPQGSNPLGPPGLRQESFGKEEETRALKPFVETLRVRIPPGKAGPAARSESCVVVGRPILRSVDSEVKGCVIEPRKYKPLGAFVLDTGGGRVRQLTHGPLSLPDPAGVEEHGQWPPGFPGNLRDPDVSIVNPDGETGTDNSLAPGGTPTTEGSKPRAKMMVSAREEIERVEKDGGESERPVVSLKRGNHPEGPRGEKGTPCHDTVGGKHGGCIETQNRGHETTTDRGTR